MTAAAAYMPAQYPHNQAVAAGIPAIPAIPLILLDAMAALGWTVEMALAAYRAAMGSQRAPAESLVSRMSQESPRQSQESPCEPVQSTDPKERKRLRDRINVAKKRAAARLKESLQTRDKSDSVAGVASDRSDSVVSLSLKENLSLKEKERVAPVANVASDKSVGRSPMPPDWQPWPKNAAFAVGELGDRGAANSTANFREHHEVAGTLMTERERQARYRKWVRLDSNRITSRQGNLALPIAGGKSVAAIMAPPSEFVTVRQGTPEAAALEARRGKPIRWGRSGICTVKATEWPPPDASTSAQQRRESG